MAVHVDTGAFAALYGRTDGRGNEDEGRAIKFVSQDSDYLVYIPGLSGSQSKATPDSDGSLTVMLQQRHLYGGLLSNPDIAETGMKFDAAGRLTAVAQTFDIVEGGVAHIPTWIPKAMIVGVEVLGVLGAFETAGVSLLVAQEVVADINTFCRTFNMMMKLARHFTDDGGALNFTAVICHDMNKTIAAVRT